MNTPSPLRELLPLTEAVERLLASTRPIAETEAVSTFDALGRVLARDLKSTLDVPPLDNRAMDGYALRVVDVPAAGTVLPVSQRIAAGQVGVPLQPGTAARIFTGAPVPPGADAVVMQELCRARRFAAAAKTCTKAPWCSRAVRACRPRRSAWPPPWAPRT